MRKNLELLGRLYDYCLKVESGSFWFGTHVGENRSGLISTLTAGVEQGEN